MKLRHLLAFKDDQGVFSRARNPTPYAGDLVSGPPRVLCPRFGLMHHADSCIKARGEELRPFENFAAGCTCHGTAPPCPATMFSEIHAK
jgi:hypothetical protein